MTIYTILLMQGKNLTRIREIFEKKRDITSA